MRLRFKLNLWISGFCGMGAVIGALCNAPAVLATSLFLSWLNWTVAIAGEVKDKEEDN